MLHVYTVRSYFQNDEQGKEVEKKFWVKIGAAFENRDGSLNVRLDALPVDGELHIRQPKPKEMGANA